MIQRAVQYAANIYRSAAIGAGVSLLHRDVASCGARVFIRDGMVCAGQGTVPMSERLAKNYLRLGILDFNVKPGVARSELSRFSVTGKETPNIKINMSIPMRVKEMFESGVNPEDPMRIFNSRWVSLRVNQVTLPNGTVYNQIDLDVRPFAIVVPVLDNGNILLQRQYRPIGSGCYSWEIPAGDIEDNEAFDAAARRELREEMGFNASEITPLPGMIRNDGGRSNGYFRMFVARGLTQACTSRDKEEHISDAREFSLQEVISMISSGEITEGCTALTIMYYALLEKGKDAPAA